MAVVIVRRAKLPSMMEKAYIPQSDGPVESTDHERKAKEKPGGEV